MTVDPDADARGFFVQPRTAKHRPFLEGHAHTVGNDVKDTVSIVIVDRQARGNADHARFADSRIVTGEGDDGFSASCG